MSLLEATSKNGFGNICEFLIEHLDASLKFLDVGSPFREHVERPHTCMHRPNTCLKEHSKLCSDHWNSRLWNRGALPYCAVRLGAWRIVHVVLMTRLMPLYVDELILSHVADKSLERMAADYQVQLTVPRMCRSRHQILHQKASDS